MCADFVFAALPVFRCVCNILYYLRQWRRYMYMPIVQ